jgi:putative two-component system response regulator
VELITEGRGSHFDADVTAAFLSIHEQFRAIALEFADE